MIVAGLRICFVLAGMQASQDGRRMGKDLAGEGPLLVATTAPAAIHAGVDVLDEGGSAVDAALTTALGQITLCAGCWVSFAGRLTALVYEAKTGEVHALNACYDVPRREDDPLSIPRPPVPSGRTALVPGFMAGVGALHERFGRVPFARLLEPSIGWARDGVPLSSSLARLIEGKRQVLLRTEAGRRIFLGEDGELVRAGRIFRQPDLARTLQNTAERGVAEFLHGEWARHFIEAVRADGGRLSLLDLERYAASWERPQSVDFHGARVYGLPAPNRGGPSAALALNLASRVFPDGDSDPFRVAAGLAGLARIEEAVNLAWSGEAPAWASIAGGGDAPELAGDHSDAIVCVDREGNVVAMLHTINTAGWGTTGIFVDGVSIPDSGASQQAAMARVGPGGRLPDHGIPMIATRDGKVVYAASATGSGNVPASWQNAIRILGCGRSPAEVADGPNLYAGRVQRGAIPDAVIDGARELGATLEVVDFLAGSEIGYWVGASFDPDTGRVHAACVQTLDGIALEGRRRLERE